MRTNRVRLAALAFALVSGCALGGARLPTAADLLSSDGEPVEANAEALQEGRSVFLKDCAECHRYYWPEEYTPTEWRALLPEMGDRTGLGDDELRALTLYLATASDFIRAMARR
jgi:cytochrome c5